MRVWVLDPNERPLSRAVVGGRKDSPGRLCTGFRSRGLLQTIAFFSIPLKLDEGGRGQKVISPVDTPRLF